MNILEVKNLFFQYPINEKNILEDISFEVEVGEFLTILGPNGSGKTTLLKILARLLKPTAGTIVLEGDVYQKFPIKNFYKITAYVPQKFTSIFPYSVYEIVLMGRTPHLIGYSFESQNDISIVNKVLDELEINHLRDKSINEISGGELQRVIIARALAQNAKILLLDEPNTHLDLKHQISVFNLLKRINANGTTIITVSHDINLSALYSERLIFLKEGKILCDGKTSEVMNEETIRQTFEVYSKIVWKEGTKLPQIFLNPF